MWAFGTNCSHVWAFCTDSSHLWKLSTNSSHVWGTSSDSSHFWKLSTNYSHLRKIEPVLHRKNTYQFFTRWIIRMWNLNADFRPRQLSKLTIRKFHIWQNLRSGTNSSHGVKFAKCEICGSTKRKQTKSKMSDKILHCNAQIHLIKQCMAWSILEHVHKGKWQAMRKPNLCEPAQSWFCICTVNSENANDSFGIYRAFE